MTSVLRPLREASATSAPARSHCIFTFESPDTAADGSPGRPSMGFARHRRVSRLPAAEGQIKYLFSKPSACSRLSWPAKHTTSVGEAYEGTISGRGALLYGRMSRSKAPAL